MSESSFSNSTLKWFLGLLGAAATAVFIGWALKYLGPKEIKEPESTFVRLDMSPSDKAEFDRMIEAIVDGAKQQGIRISDADETQVMALLGWATQRVLNTGKPGITYIVGVPSDYALSKGIKEFRLTSSHKFQTGDNAECVEIKTSYNFTDGSSEVNKNTHCLVAGHWKAM